MQILRLSNVGQKFTKFFMTFSKGQVSSSSNFVSFFSVITHNFPVIQSLCTLIKRSPWKWKFSNFWKLGQNLSDFSYHFSKNKSVPSHILHHSSVSWHITYLYFFASNIFVKSGTSKWNFSDLPLLAWKTPHVIFGTKGHFYFKHCITLQCHDTQLFCTFPSKTLYALDKRSLSKYSFSDFWLV